MRLSNIAILVLALTFGLCHAAQAAKLHTYVLSYEGPIDGDTAAISAALGDLWKDLDSTKVSSEVMHQNFPQTKLYTIEAFVEPASDQMIAYLEDFVHTHGEFNIGNVKIQLKPVAQIADLFSVECFGLDASGTKEMSFGAFNRYRQFSSVGAYQTSIMNLGMLTAQGDENEIKKALLPILNPVDAKSFEEWLTGAGSNKQKISRFHWNSNSFFVMQDGSFVARLMSWHLDRSMIAPAPTKSMLLRTLTY